MTTIETDKVKNFFDEPQKYLHKDFGIKIRRDIVGRMVKDLPYKHILDVGCGDGSISLPLLNGATTLDLVDLSSGMLALAKAKIPEGLQANVSFENVSLEKLNTHKNYDLILAIGLLAHVPDVEKAIAILGNMLTPGGHLIFQFSEASKLATKMSFRVRKTGHHKLNKIYKKTLVTIFEKNNFKLTNEISFATIFPGMGMLKNELLYNYCRYTINNKLFSLINSEYIMMVTRK